MSTHQCTARNRAASGWSEHGAVGKAESEGGGVFDLSLSTRPGEAAGEEDGGLVDGAGALAGGGHGGQGAFQPGAAQCRRVGGGEGGGEPVAPKLAVAVNGGRGALVVFEVGQGGAG